MGLLGTIKQSKSDRSKKYLEALGAKLLALRQACCHPQLGAKGVQGGRRLGSNNDNAGVMSMDAIFSKLMDGVRTKCEESQRLQLMALCGMAGVARIQADSTRRAEISAKSVDYLSVAAKAYRDAVSLYESNRRECAMIGTVFLRGDAALRATSEECVADNIPLTWSSTTAETSKQGSAYPEDARSLDGASTHITTIYFP